MIPFYLSLSISILFTIIFILGFKQKRLYCPSKGIIHHFYLGSIIFLFTSLQGELIPLLSFCIAVFIWVDDFEQHVIQVDNPDYHSFLHKFYAKYIWRYLDNFFKKFPWIHKNIWSKL